MRFVTPLLLVTLVSSACSTESPEVEVEGEVRGDSVDVTAAFFFFKVSTSSEDSTSRAEITLWFVEDETTCADHQNPYRPPGDYMEVEAMNSKGELRDPTYAFGVTDQGDFGGEITLVIEENTVGDQSERDWLGTSTSAPGEIVGTFDLLTTEQFDEPGSGGDRLSGRFTATHCKPFDYDATEE